MRGLRARTIALLIGVILFAALVWAAPPYARALSFVVRSAGLEEQHPTIARWQTVAFQELATQVPSRHGPLRGRLYRPARISRAVLLVPGINAMALDEPRLIAFARQLAAAGLAVVTVELPDLARYQVTPRSTDMIEDAAAWLAGRHDLAAGGRVGVMGISFAGSLGVVAAGRPSLHDRVAFVFSFGGHADFINVLRFLCTGIEPIVPGSPSEPAAGEKRVQGGIWRQPHDYGVAVLALGLADRLVPPDQVEPLREAILTFLHASHLALYDRGQAGATFARARAMAEMLGEPAATIMRQVNERDVAALGPRLLPHIPEYGKDPALSPVRSPAPEAPVYLLHGTDDNVIPARETLILAKHLEGKTRVHWLLSGLISHAQVTRAPSVGEVWELVRFWASLFRQ